MSLLVEHAILRVLRVSERSLFFPALDTCTRYSVSQCTSNDGQGPPQSPRGQMTADKKIKWRRGHVRGGAETLNCDISGQAGGIDKMRSFLL